MLQWIWAEAVAAMAVKWWPSKNCTRRSWARSTASRCSATPVPASTSPALLPKRPTDGVSGKYLIGPPADGVHRAAAASSVGTEFRPPDFRPFLLRVCATTNPLGCRTRRVPISLPFPPPNIPHVAYVFFLAFSDSILCSQNPINQNENRKKKTQLIKHIYQQQKPNQKTQDTKMSVIIRVN